MTPENVDCSEKNLRKIVTQKFGDKPYDNEWLVYSFLKTYCGVNYLALSTEKYNSVMAVIKKVSGV